MVAITDEEQTNRLYNMYKVKESKLKRLIFVNPYQEYDAIERANTLVKVDGVKGGVNAVLYYDEKNPEQVLSVDEFTST